MSRLFPIAAAFIGATLLSALLTPAVRRWATARGLLDDALTLRRRTGKPVPRLGGLAVVVGFAAGFAAAWAAGAAMADLLPLLAGGVAIAALGVYDDLRGAGAEKKFLIQFAVAFALFAAGFRAEIVVLPGVGTHDLGVLMLPVTVLWLAGASNAINLIDGLDGLAVGVCAAAAGALGLGAFARGDLTAAAAMASLGGATLGFGFYNRRPASIFLGDGGSLFLGLVLAGGCLRPGGAAALSGDLTMPALALALPVIDTGAAIVRRLRAHRRLFMADRQHVHHRLSVAFGEPTAVWILWTGSVLTGLCAVALAWLDGGPH